MDGLPGRSTGLGLEEDEECEAVSIMQGEKASTTHYGSLNLQSTFKPATPVKAVDESLKLDLLGDQDSGFRGSSSFKGASSFKNSISCSDDGDDSDEERPGCFDYTPLINRGQSAGHVRIRPTLNPEYDEDIKVDSSTGGSSVESPRSEASVTHEEYNLTDDIEMQTFSHSTQEYQRRSHDDYFNPHQQLYGAKRGGGFDEFWHERHHSPMDAKSGLRHSNNCCQDPILGASALGQQKGSVSKKTRRRSKDDSDKVTGPVRLDVNGNPKPFEIRDYAQMRQPIPSSQGVDGGPLATQSNHHSLTSQTSLGLEQNSDLEKKRQRKAKKQEKQKGQPSEAIENFKGNQAIDDLLSFIEGGNNHKKRGKDTTQQQNGPGTVKGDKPKKKQDKNKQNLLNGQEEKATDSIPAKSSPAVTESLSMVMGNTTAKDCPQENHKSVSTTPTSATTSSSPTGKKEHSIHLEEPDQNSGEFFDCLNSFPSDISAEKEKDSSAKPETVHIVLESSGNLSKEVTMVDDSKNPNVEKKSSQVVKANGKKAKSPDFLYENDESHKRSYDQIRNSENKNPVLSSSSKDSKEKIDESVNQVLSQAFIEVKKKKKRNPIKDAGSVPNSGSFQPNHSFIPKGINGPSYSNNNKTRPQKPAQFSTSSFTSVSNTMTPSIGGANNSNLVINTSKDDAALDKFSRDLSPSSFPVLMCHNNNTSIAARPERRNSCGDINDVKGDVSETRSYCDSDKESVKSLPAAHNVRAAGECSPLFPVSYATMVAAAQRHNHGDSSNSPSSESGIVCGSQNSSINSCHPLSSLETVSPPPSANTIDGSSVSSGAGSTTPDRKTTKWKGSPRERRHSIGSSPDDKPEPDKSCNSSRNRQKSGSQECLAILLTSSHPGSKEAEESLSSSEEVLDPSLESKSDNPPGSSRKNSSNTETSKKSTSPSVTLSVPTHPVQTGSNTSKPSTTKMVGVGSQPASPTTQNITSSSSSSSSQHGVVGKSNRAETINVPGPKKTCVALKSGSAEAASKKTNTNNTKSVIFLDKRFGGNTTDLGITFGFDSSIEPSTDWAGSSKATDASSTICSSSSASSHSSSSTSPSSSQQQQVLTVVSSSSSSISNIPAVQIRTTSSSEHALQHQSSDNKNHQPPIVSINSTEKVQKDAYKAKPCNGLVIPASSVIQGSAKAKDSTSSVVVRNSQNNVTSNKNIVGKTDQTGKGTSPPPSNINMSTSNNVSRASPSQTPQPSSLPLASEKPFKGTKAAPPSVPSNQPQPSDGSGPKRAGTRPPTGPTHHPSAPTNGPILIPNAFTVVPVPVVFSPHYPPPPIRQVVPMPVPPGIVEVPSIVATMPPSATNPPPTIATPPVQQKSEIPVTHNAYVPPSSSSSVSKPSSSPPSPTPLPQSTTTVTSLGTSAVSAENEPAQSLEGPIKVVYGLRIKPDGGCGTLYFRPPAIQGRQKKSGMAEVPIFLKKKWTEVKDIQNKDSERYVSVRDQ